MTDNPNLTRPPPRRNAGTHWTTAPRPTLWIS